jgi:hypothetical protein
MMKEVVCQSDEKITRRIQAIKRQTKSTSWMRRVRRRREDGGVVRQNNDEVT